MTTATKARRSIAGVATEGRRYTAVSRATNKPAARFSTRAQARTFKKNGDYGYIILDNVIQKVIR